MSGNKFNGDKLFEARKMKKLSQTKLALLVGVSRQTIYLWESNQTIPDVEKVSRICEVLEINMKDLFDNTEIINDDENNNIENFNIVENNKIIETNDNNSFEDNKFLETNDNNSFEDNKFLETNGNNSFENNKFIETNDNNILYNNKVHKNYREDNTNNLDNKNKKTKSVCKKLVIILLIILLSTYIITSLIKFIRLNEILNGWKELDKIDHYYIEIEEYLVHEKDEDIILENYFYEKYYHNGVLKTIMKDRKDNKIQSIIICDYNKMKKYIIYEETKTYLVKKIYKTDTKTLTSNYYFVNNITNNNFMNFLNCFSFNFDIEKSEKYKIISRNRYKEVINKENYVLEYEENFDNNIRKNKRYYKIELNSTKDFEINLDEYTEIE